MRVPSFPNKTNSPLVVDAQAMPFTVSSQRVQAITRRHPQIRNELCRMEDQQFSPSRLPDVCESRHALIVKEPLRITARKGFYHMRRI
jgi:hypothetical protein